MRRCSCRCTHCIEMGNVPKKKKEKHEVFVAPAIQRSEVRPASQPERIVDGCALVPVQQAAVLELATLRDRMGSTAYRLCSVKG